MADDPFALFDAWFAEARASEPNDPDAMALATADADGRPSVRMVLLQGATGPTASSSTPTSTAARASELAANPQRRLAVPLEVAAPPGARRRAGRAGQRRRGRRLFRQPQPRFAASAPGHRTSRGRWPTATTFERRVARDASAVRGRRRARARRAGRASAWSPTGSNSGATAPTGSTSGACSRATATAGAKACSTHEPRIASSTPHALEARDARRAGQRLRSRCCCSGSRRGRPVTTDSMAMLGSLADTALDLIASLVTLAGVRIAALPADSDHRFGHGKAEALVALVQIVLITVSAAWIGYRSVERLLAGAPTGAAELGIGVSLVAMAATLAAARLPAPRRRRDRIGRDRHRPCPLPVGPAAQRRRSSPRWCSTRLLGLVGADAVFGLRDRGVAAVSARGARRARRSTS